MLNSNKVKKFYFSQIFVLLTLATFASSVQAAQEKPSGEKPLENSTLEFKEFTLVIKDQKEIIPQDKLKEWITVEPSLKINFEKRSEAENVRFCPSDQIFCSLILSLRDPYFLKKETRIKVDEEKVAVSIQELAEKFNKDPVNAKFKMENSEITNFVPSAEGIKVNVDKSVKIISENISKLINSQEINELSLSYETIEPEITTSSVNNLGINTLIGEGISNFRGSPKNRIFNIGVATEKFDGILIGPGEEFSFIETLGPVDGENGYAPELVIKKDKTEPEFGGGICQVSTTAFRAAINSGLKVTMRKNHAYPVAYYNPQGMDATVYVPRPDLRFINNTPNHILIQTKIEGSILTFQFYGTSDGRKVELTGPKILERKPDGSMKTTFNQKVYDKDGNVFINDTFNSNYDSPSKYPHPGEEKLKKKPKGWSDNEWEKYKKTNGL